jgi:hypothetical protein
MIRAGVEGQPHALAMCLASRGELADHHPGTIIFATRKTFPQGKGLSPHVRERHHRLPDSGRSASWVPGRTGCANTYYSVTVIAARAEVETMAEPRNPAHVLGVGA